jgi:hypothetical protein
MSTDVSDKEHLAQVGSPGNWLLEVEHGSRAVGRPILIGAVIRTESSAYLLVRMSTERRVRVTDDYIVLTANNRCLSLQYEGRRS